MSDESKSDKVRRIENEIYQLEDELEEAKVDLLLSLGWVSHGNGLYSHADYYDSTRETLTEACLAVGVMEDASSDGRVLSFDNPKVKSK